MTEDQIREWLLRYAWSGTPEEQAREVECIMSQVDWQYVDGRIEKFVGQAWNPGAAGVMQEATEFALSALYECHDEPHLTTCPRFKP